MLLERKRLTLLILGDLFVVLLTTLAGFANHGELQPAAFDRMAATFLPFAAAWLLVAPWLGCFEARWTSGLAHLWRPPLAALLAAPLGAVLRGLWLGAPVLPVFAVVMGAVLGAAMFVWRLLAAALLRRMTPLDG
jgi:hypothetical protein